MSYLAGIAILLMVLLPVGGTGAPRMFSRLSAVLATHSTGKILNRDIAIPVVA